MKLDKIRFAQVIGYIGRQFAISFSDTEVRMLDELIEFQAPPAPMMNAETLHVLLALMQEGKQKIEAIKQHRMMTGYGLKESKDIIEKYWRPAPKIEEPATLGDILNKATNNN